MIKTDELRGLIAKYGYSGARFAREVLKITPNTFYKKMKEGIFGSDEIELMISELHIEDPIGIFFAKPVA